MRVFHAPRGFTMVELMVTIVIFGLLMGIGTLGLVGFKETNQLQGASENLAAQLRLAREKAISTGQSQTMIFAMDHPVGKDWDYHINNGGTPGPGWCLPNGVSYDTVTVNPTFSTDGRASSSGMIVLQNTRGQRDTVSLQMSGFVISR